MAERNYFEDLNSVDVSKKIEKKNGLSYLSWAFAWGELKKRYPDSTYTIYENAEGWNYFTDGKTCWVKTGVTVKGIEHVEYLPVMDYRNRSIPAEQVTSFDVNKAIQRSLTKAVARHGLGLYIYAGEDLPEQATVAQNSEKQEQKKQEKPTTWREALRDLCKSKGLDQKMIIETCGLHQNSTEDEFYGAYMFAYNMAYGGGEIK